MGGVSTISALSICVQIVSNFVFEGFGMWFWALPLLVGLFSVLIIEVFSFTFDFVICSDIGALINMPSFCMIGFLIGFDHEIGCT